MQPGRLDQQIVIEGPTQIPDGYGGVVDAGWGEVGRAWASVEPLRGREAIANMAVTPSQTWRIWVRRDVEITAAHRILWGGRILNVREAPDPRREAYRQIVAEDQQA